MVNKRVKITGLIVLVIMISVVAYLWYLTDFEPRRPKQEIPITYNIGWWSDQEELSVDSLKVDIVESHLSLFNNKSLISYSVSGELTYKGYWQPKIDEVHISERINLDTILNCDRIIEITPVIKTKENKKVMGGTEKFQFRNEHTISSNHWGINRIKFICGRKEQVIELQQVK